MSSPRRKQDFEHSFKRIRRIDPRREAEEDQNWKRDLEEQDWKESEPDVAIQEKTD